MHDPREFSVSLFADASFWRARLWALVGDQPDAYELPEHRSALAELLQSLAATGCRFRVESPRYRRPKSPPPLHSSAAALPAAAWLEASNPDA
jgi:hypothetical protein